MRYHATHITTYTYQEPVAQCLTEARLTPRAFDFQTVEFVNLDVDPPPLELQRRRDYFGNEVTAFAIFRPHDRFVVKAESLVEVLPRPQGPLPSLSWEQAREILAAHPDADTLAAYEFAFASPYIEKLPALADYAAPTFTPGRPLADAVLELNHRIHTEFVYKPAATSIDMPLAEVLQLRQGVCQDFAHIMIGALRSLRLAARYVSGYLKSGAQYEGAEASHAWVSVYLPGFGWLDLDPTNDVRPTDGHVTLAWGRDYGDVAPLKGISLGGGGQKVAVEVRVVPA
jgi:transglutaminase-like putative cysteine protease